MWEESGGIDFIGVEVGLQVGLDLRCELCGNQVLYDDSSISFEDGDEQTGGG